MAHTNKYFACNIAQHVSNRKKKVLSNIMYVKLLGKYSWEY